MHILEADPATLRPRQPEPDDFDEFWAETLAQTREHPLDPSFTPRWVRAVTVHDVSFRGYGGTTVRASLVTRSEISSTWTSTACRSSP